MITITATEMMVMEVEKALTMMEEEMMVSRR